MSSGISTVQNQQVKGIGPARKGRTMKTSMTGHKKATLALLGMFILSVVYGVFVMGIR
jgi:hypothetical protein